VFGNPADYSNDALKLNMEVTFGETLGTLNPPVHTRYRKVFRQAFLPHIINKWGSTIVTPVINGVIDKLSGLGRADLVRECARLYPFHIIYRQLDLPVSDISVFHKLAVVQLIVINQFFLYAMESSRKLGVYFTEMMEERRRNPSGDGLIDVLINAEAEGECLPDNIVLAF